MNPAQLAGKAVLRFSSATTNVVAHGNSIIKGDQGTYSPWPAQLGAMPPINGALTVTNKGVNGQRWAGMMTSGTGAEVDALFVEGKRNILLAWEGHNEMNVGISTSTPYTMLTAGRALAAIQAAQAYTAERLAVHPKWIILHMTCLPAYYTMWDDPNAALCNAVFDEYNARLKAGARAMGAYGVIDSQMPGSPFLLPDKKRTTFAAAMYQGKSIWSPADQFGGYAPLVQNQFVHPSNEGYYALGREIIAPALRRIPAWAGK